MATVTIRERMCINHLQKVVDKNGVVRVSQYGLFDGAHDCQGLGILIYLISGNLDKYQNNLENINQLTKEQIKNIPNEKFKKLYPYMFRDCGYKIHRMIEEGSVKFVDLFNKEEDGNIEGLYTIDFQNMTFTSEFHEFKKAYSLSKLPTVDEYLYNYRKELI